MSIYVVDFKNDDVWKKYYKNLKWYKYKCCVCGKSVNSSHKFLAYHALPWGYAPDEVWCSNKCLNNKKVKSD